MLSLMCMGVAWSAPTCRPLARAMDASPLGQRFTLLVISVVVRGGAIPVAWHVVEATRPGAWRPHWDAVLRHLHGSVPPAWTVIVLADRGLYAHWLFTTMQRLGWHPFLRSNRQGQYRPQGVPTFRPRTQGSSRIGQRWAGPVPCVATAARHLPCPLLARGDPGYREPWLVVTALPCMQADGAWYGLRAWSECGCKDSQRGGGHGEQTQEARPGPGRAPLVRAGGRHFVDRQWGLPGRRHPAAAGLDTLARAPYGSTTRLTVAPVPLAQLFPAWLLDERGGVMHGAGTPAGTGMVRAMAPESDGPRQSG